LQTNTPQKDSEQRMKRGMDMLQGGATVQENEDGSFMVPSQTSAAKSYEVRILGERMVCTCPDFEYRQIEACKHIHLVKFTLSVKYLQDEPKPKVFAEDAIPCDKCGSIKIIRYGISSGKQVFKCKECMHKFREPSILKRARFTPELVTLTLDLYFSGLSLRKITRTLSNHFNIDVNYATIYRWIAKYVPMISEYVNELSPQLSKTWHADELFVRVRGGTHKNQGIGFVWNIMDRQTRFLIVSKLTTTRTAVDTAAAFEEAQHNAHGIEPETVFTDSLRHYKSGVKTFANAKRVENCGISKHENNNRIERLNGTLRERVKVQRGWKTGKTPIAEGQRIHYNFVKPHMALEGKTPASAAGLQVEDRNKWLTLIKHSIRNKG
jgi:putative transposase